MKEIQDFINAQLSQWPMACENFRALRKVQEKSMKIGCLEVKIQFNPSRIASATAEVDEATLKARACFLCPEHRFPEQIFMRFEGRKGKKYDILLNPYPIFPDHLVIALAAHREQSIWKRYVDILDMSRAYRKYVFMYNGPQSGASAPDHHHFQATGCGKLPLEKDVDALLEGMPASGSLEYLASVQDADLFHYKGFTTGIFVLRARTVKSSAKLFYRLLDCAPVPEGDKEPRFNLFTYYKSGEYRSIVIFRSSHRSHHYFAEGDEHLTMSPGCVDMAGIFIVPVEEDFKKINEKLLSDMVAEISLSQLTESMIVRRLTRAQRWMNVGIMSAREIVFEIKSDGAGPRKAVYHDGKIEYDGALYDELYFGSNTPSSMFAEYSFILYNVTIGKGFHWERTENQKFAGALKIIVEGDGLTAVNVIGVEDYLLSVISSEMKSDAYIEFLKAHAVISRSWVMARLKEKSLEIDEVAIAKMTETMDGVEATVGDTYNLSNENETIKWYGSSQHSNFDVCADDHCQRYQGLTRAVGTDVQKAVDATWGEILTFDGKICDTRFSKCCGGVSERFSTCWEDVDFPYLAVRQDIPGLSDTHPFCDTSDKAILSRVLNSYDLETNDFYRWSVKYSRDDLSYLVAKNSGKDIGRLVALEPLERGGSGRICKLRIVGDKATIVVGKELEIRRVLSTSHLKSSAFEVEYLKTGGNGGDSPQKGVSGDSLSSRTSVDSSADWGEVVLHGKGWGHGVGLCQIGAAVMASRGYDYRQILQHYYPGAVISTIPDK